MKGSARAVMFREETQALEFYQNGSWIYSVPLEKLTDSANVLDWILQVAAKGWCTGDLLKAFLDQLAIVCLAAYGDTPQGCFCPQGQPSEVKWTGLKNEQYSAAVENLATLVQMLTESAPKIDLKENDDAE